MAYLPAMNCSKNKIQHFGDRGKFENEMKNEKKKEPTHMLWNKDVCEIYFF